MFFDSIDITAKISNSFDIFRLSGMFLMELNMPKAYSIIDLARNAANENAC